MTLHHLVAHLPGFGCDVMSVKNTHLHFWVPLANTHVGHRPNLLMSALQLLYDTFNAFGVIVQTPKIMRDPETGLSRGFGFVSYDSFEASDAAIEAMNGQFLCNRSASGKYVVAL
jgi:RNA recognition motif. (a.k.a. RRM, RBD, or RNP domain)